MAYFKQKNKRVNITPLFCSQIISRFYSEAYNENVFKYREEISKLTNDFYQATVNKFTTSSEVEVPYIDVIFLLKTLLPKERRTIFSVIDAHLLPNETAKIKQNVKWSIAKEEHSSVYSSSSFSLFHEKEAVSLKDNKTVFNYTIEITRQEWIIFLQKLCAEYVKLSGNEILFSHLKNELEKLNKNYIKSEEEWYQFFYDLFLSENFQRIEPRSIYLAQALRIRKYLSDLVNCSWLTGTGFNEREQQIHKNRPIFNFKQDPVPHRLFNLGGNAEFKLIWLDYLKTTKINTHLFDTNALSNVINLNNEYKISWLAYYLLKKDDILFPFGKGVEPVQFLFMNVAMLIAEKTPNPTEFAIDFYHRLSQLEIILPNFLLKHFNEIARGIYSKDTTIKFDYSHSIADTFEALHGAVTNSIVKTKWSGEAFLNFNRIRKIHSPIRNGLRISNGVEPYINMLNELIKSQGREQGNFPISVSLPIWHYEILSLLSLSESAFAYSLDKEEKEDIEKIERLENSAIKQEELLIHKQHLEEERLSRSKGDHLYRVILLSDEFMLRLLSPEETSWYLFDPHYLKNNNIDITLTKHYKQAEQLVLDKKIPTKYYKEVKVKQLFKKLLKKTTQHNLVFIFEDIYTSQKLLDEVSLTYGHKGNCCYPLENNLNEEQDEIVNYSHVGFNLLPHIQSSGLESHLDTHSLNSSLLSFFRLLKILKSIYPELNLSYSLLGLSESIFKLIPFDKVKDNGTYLTIGQNLLFKYFQSLSSVKLENSVEFSDFDLANNIESFNEYLTKLTKKRDNATQAALFSSEFDKRHQFNNRLIDYSLGNFANEEIAYMANTKTTHVGIHKYLIEVVENGKRFYIHSPTFLAILQEKKTDFENFQPAFLRNTIPYFYKYESLYKEFIYSKQWILVQIQLYSRFFPFYKQGLSITLPTNKRFLTADLQAIVEYSWLQGFSNIQFV